MSEAIALDLSQFEGCVDVRSAAFLWASRNETPTWNGWVSIIRQLRRLYPDDPAHSELYGASEISAWTNELFSEIMEHVYGLAWEPARRPGAVGPRRPYRAYPGVRPGGSRSLPEVHDRQPSSRSSPAAERPGSARSSPAVEDRPQRVVPSSAEAAAAAADPSER